MTMPKHYWCWWFDYAILWNVLDLKYLSNNVKFSYSANNRPALSAVRDHVSCTIAYLDGPSSRQIVEVPVYSTGSKPERSLEVGCHVRKGATQCPAHQLRAVL